MIPPRKKPTMRQMLAPKIPADVTETRRQGQGIGDIQAIGQMARTVIPEVLRNAPVTSVPMAGYDALQASRQGDMTGAALAALGAIPFAGAMKYADEAGDVARAAMRGAEELPMDTKRRMLRAYLQGYTQPVYHGTTATQPIDVLLPASALGKRLPDFDLDAVHVGTKLQANERLGDIFSLGRAKNVQYQSAKKANVARGWGNERLERAGQSGAITPERAPSVMPLLMKPGKEFINEATGSPYTEQELLREIERFSRLTPDVNSMSEAKQRFKEHLLKLGYDTVPYLNQFEGAGQLSYMVLRPENLRSQFAKFDPANVGKAGLMGGLAGILGIGAYRNQQGQEDL